MTAQERGPALWPRFVLLASLVVIADQVTKALLVGALRPGESTDVIGDLVRFVHAQNSGGLFGMFRDAAPIFAVASIFVIGLIAWYHGRAGRSPYLTLTLGLLLGGAIGNLIDRLRYGHVVDWVDAGVGSFRWYTFNVADAAISGALLLLILLALRPGLAEPR